MPPSTQVAIASRSLLRARHHRAFLRHPAARVPINLVNQHHLPLSILPTAFALRHPLCSPQLARHHHISLQPCDPPQNSPSSPAKTTKMASDEDYGNFLDKANQDTGASKAFTQSTSKPSTKAVDTDVPAPLQTVEQYYTSEADEPFEPVSLKWEGGNMPCESMLTFSLNVLHDGFIRDGAHGTFMWRLES